MLFAATFGEQAIVWIVVVIMGYSWMIQKAAKTETGRAVGKSLISAFMKRLG